MCGRRCEGGLGWMYVLSFVSWCVVLDTPFLCLDLGGLLQAYCFGIYPI